MEDPVEENKEEVNWSELADSSDNDYEQALLRFETPESIQLEHPNEVDQSIEAPFVFETNDSGRLSWLTL